MISGVSGTSWPGRRTVWARRTRQIEKPMTRSTKWTSRNRSTRRPRHHYTPTSNGSDRDFDESLKMLPESRNRCIQVAETHARIAEDLNEGLRVIRNHFQETATATLALTCGKNDRGHNEALYLQETLAMVDTLLARDTHVSDRVSCYRMSRLRWIGCVVVVMGVLWWYRISDCEIMRSCRVFTVIQDAISLILHYRTMYEFRTISSSTFVTSDVQSIYTPSRIQDWYQEDKIWAKDRRYSSRVWIQWTRNTKIWM